MKPHLFHPAASEEYAEAVKQYAATSPELGSRFRDEIERLLLAIRRQPDRFFRFNPPARRALSQKFPFGVVYLKKPECVWVLAVMQVKRRLGYWRGRMD